MALRREAGVIDNFEEVSSGNAIHKFTLFFQLPHLEFSFDAFHLEKSRRTMRTAIFVSVLLWSLFLVGDQFVWKQYAAARKKNLILRIFTIIPSIVGLVLSFQVPKVYTVPRIMQILLSFLAILGGEAILLSKEFNKDFSPSPAVIVLMMGVFALSRTKFTWSTVICTVMAASFQIWLIASPVSTRVKVINAFPIWAAAGLAILNGYISELNLRRGFLESALIAHESEVLRQEKSKTQLLLANILPMSISERLIANPAQVISDRYEECTILFGDIVGFTSISERTDAHKLVAFLNDLFSLFDSTILAFARKQCPVEKIKTIGDAYMVVGGVPMPHPESCHWIAEFGLSMLEKMKELKTPINQDCNMRIGMHMGPVTAGVIGRQKFFYDLWGDSVNIASRMESTGRSGMIQTTAAIYQRLGNHYTFEERGLVEVKGKGSILTYFLLRTREPGMLNTCTDVLEACSVSTVATDNLCSSPGTWAKVSSANNLLAKDNREMVLQVARTVYLNDSEAELQLVPRRQSTVMIDNRQVEQDDNDADARAYEEIYQSSHPVKLTFKERTIEADYRQNRSLRSVRFFRNSTLCGLLLEVVLAIIDVVVFPPSIRVCWPIRFGGICVLVLILFGVSFSRAAYKVINVLAAVVVLVMGFGEFVIIWWTPQPVLGNTIPFTTVAACVKCAHVSVRIQLIMMLLNTFVQLRFVVITPLGLLAIIGYVILVGADSWVRKDVASVLVFLVPAQLITMVIAYTAESKVRREYLNDRLLQRKKEKIMQQQAKSDDLLRNILPDHIIATLKANQSSGTVIAEQIDNATVLFADIVGFTSLSSNLRPEAIVSMLNRVFTAFDELAEQHRVLKIKTIGDAYLSVAGPGLTVGAADNSAAFAPAYISTRAIARMALGMQAAVSAQHSPSILIRIGVHTGPVVAGVIGTVKFCYDVWGDSVNLASRLESSGTPGRIQVSDTVYSVLRTAFRFSDPRDLTVKGKAERVRAWFLESEIGTETPT